MLASLSLGIVKLCMHSDLYAILSDETNINYDDKLFYALIHNYYKEENEMSLRI